MCLTRTRLDKGQFSYAACKRDARFLCKRRPYRRYIVIKTFLPVRQNQLDIQLILSSDRSRTERRLAELPGGRAPDEAFGLRARRRRL